MGLACTLFVTRRCLMYQVQYKPHSISGDPHADCGGAVANNGAAEDFALPCRHVNPSIQ